MTTQSISEKLKLKIVPLTLVVGGLALVGISSFLFLSTVKSPTKQTPAKTKTVEILNREFVQKATEYVRSLPPEQSTLLDSLRQAAQERQEKMSIVARTDPRKFLDLATSPSLRQQLPEEVHRFVEQSVTKAGRLNREHEDYFSSGTSKEKYYLHSTDDPDASRVPVFFASPPETGFVGTTIRVHGYDLGGDVVAAGGTEIIVLASAVTEAPAVGGSKKIAVVLVDFQNTTPPAGITVDEARGRVFTYPDSVNSYYQEISGGAVSLVGKNNQDGDVYGWVEIPKNNTPCQYGVWGNSARAVIENSAPGTLSGYDKILYVFNNGSCGALQGVAGQDVYIMVFDRRVVAHELGHWFGTDHASTANNCTSAGTPVTICQNHLLSVGEYGDPYDPMGNAYRHMANNRKGHFGWYSTPATVDITATTANIVLEPATTPGSGTKVIRMPRTFYNGQLRDYYYLEYRRPFGTFENYSSAGYEFNGLLARIAPPYGSSAQTFLLDATPGSVYGYGDAAMAVGQELFDVYRGIKIRTVGVTPTQATLDVTITCVPQGPSLVAGSYTPAVRPGQAGTYGFVVANTDNPYACQTPGQYALSAALPSGWSMPTPPPATLGSNTTGTVTLTITPPSTAADGPYIIPVTLTRLDVSVPIATYNLVITVDSIPPVVSIAQPAADSILPTAGMLTIMTNPADYDDGYDITIQIDSATVKECPDLIGEACTYDWAIDAVSPGAHTITATSIDSANNTGTTTITVYYPSSGGGGIDPIEIE